MIPLDPKTYAVFFYSWMWFPLTAKLLVIFSYHFQSDWALEWWLFLYSSHCSFLGMWFLQHSRQLTQLWFTHWRCSNHAIVEFTRKAAEKLLNKGLSFNGQNLRELFCPPRWTLVPLFIQCQVREPRRWCRAWSPSLRETPLVCGSLSHPGVISHLCTDRERGLLHSMDPLNVEKFSIKSRKIVPFYRTLRTGRSGQGGKGKKSGGWVGPGGFWVLVSYV